MMNRRTFIKNTALASAAGLAGLDHALAQPSIKYGPAGLTQTDPLARFDKDSAMVVLNDRPVNVEAQAHLLDDKITPAERMFIRNNGVVPASIDREAWKLLINGESVAKQKEFGLKELIQRFTHHTYQLTLECGGNGRSEFNPPAKGNQWTVGAVSCADWTGIRLRDLLEDVGIKEDAVYIGYYGADTHLSGDPGKVVISRGIPLAKGMQDETLLAFQMNGKDIPMAHGFPLRLVAGGWPASASGKWLKQLSIRNQVHDGPKMGGQSYRVPCNPVPPGSKVEDKDMCIIESMPVKSLITSPKTGAMLKDRKTLSISGHAWAGELEVSRMDWSIDFGATWNPCQLERPANRLAWQHWDARVTFPKQGYYEVWARATDSKGNMQPIVVPGWNPKGYLNNACHRIAVKVV